MHVKRKKVEIARRLRAYFTAFLLFWAVAAPASAHPLGNFSINHLSVIERNGSSVHIKYVLDQAEIPSFAILRAGSDAGRIDKNYLDRWSKQESARIVRTLHLEADGKPQTLTVDAAHVATRPGAGGLATIYLTIEMHSLLPESVQALRYTDNSFPDRIGWKDIVVRPAHEPTDELRVYPPALTGSPRNITTYETGAKPAAAVTRADAAPSNARSNQLSDLLAAGTRDWRAVLLTFLVAIGLGALHALEPGHGKTLMAVSLVGARATAKQACILAGSITFAHTIGVIVLGVVILVGAAYIVPEQIYPWITLVSGIAIAVLGARSLARVVRRHQPMLHAHAHTHLHAHQHDHAHAHAFGDLASDHHHDNLSDEEHARAHAAAFSGPLTFRGVVLAAMSGGIAPCPAALVVLLTAVTLHQIAYGLAIIVAFSFGLAGVLTGVGIAVVRSAGWLSERAELARFVRYGPLVSAAVIALIGAGMVGQGFIETGVSIPWIAVSALAVVAIAAYAVFPHTHAIRTSPESQ